MSDFDWTERFPDMKPIRSAPTLMRINGIGCAVYGSRDADAETGTYVKTYCLSILFLPVLALTAYRVADAPGGGWYFLGRVPLSAFAKTWNGLVLLAILGFAGWGIWESYTHSPDYLAGRKLTEADDLAAGGQLVRAAQTYGEVAVGGGSHAVESAERLKGLLGDPRMHTSLRDAAGVFQAAINARQQINVQAASLEERGLQLIDQHADDDPRGGLALLDVLAPIAATPQKLNARRQSLLERLVAREPNDVESVSRLALLYEETNQAARCEELLMPRKDRLGDGEGARILGQILVGKDKFADACAVLEPYTQRHLPELQAAEQAFHTATNGLINQIKMGNAPGFPYQRLDHADKAEQQAIFSEYFNSRLKDDPLLRKAQETYQRSRRVVPAVLDLGVALLRNAQMRPDPAAREADLKKAEKVFLAIENDQEAATKEYRVSLGQVYYWLGKHQEGRKKFDEVLAAENRSYEMLILIGHALREVGAQAEACAMFEEAYNKEKDEDKKYQAAAMRAVLALELEERITWLQRANPNDASIKVKLCAARGEKALQDGQLAEAETQLRQAIDMYAKMPEDAAVLNNGALVHMALYRVTGDRQLLEKAETMMDKAVALDSRNSILLGNAADTLLDTAVRDVIGNTIDLKKLKKSGDYSLLAYLYADQAGKRRLTERLRVHPAAIKATSFLERLLVLAPKNPGVYRQLRTQYAAQRNSDKLRDLLARLEKAEPDLTTQEKVVREYLAGKRDEQLRKEAEAQCDRYTKLIEEMGQGQRGITYAVAAAELVSLKMSLDNLGRPADADEVVSLAESAHAAAPSDATRRTLEVALLFRASRNLAQKDPAFAALVSRTRRSLEAKDRIAVALMREGETRQNVLADADVKRTLDLIRDSRRQFPDDPSKWVWIILRAADAEEAAKLAKVIHDDPMEAMLRDIDWKLAPFSAGIALRTCWSLQAAGKDQEGTAVLKQCAARGVPMPELP